MSWYRCSPRASGQLVADFPSTVHFSQCELIIELHISSPYWLVNTIWDIFSGIITSSGSFPYNIGNLLKIGSSTYFFTGHEQPPCFHIEGLVFLLFKRVAQFSLDQNQCLLILPHLNLGISYFMLI